MTVTGIICEYNPFHNGHLYHINETKKLCGTDTVIAIMSGDYVQRGEPALVDKYTRTRMALLAGVSIVIELPVRFATMSAEGFAYSSIDILKKTGIADSICFGSEAGSLIDIQKLADIIINEPTDVSKNIKKYLKEGNSYPKARMMALSPYANINYTPNNILAVEYMKALHDSDITPYTITRNDNGYNNDDINQHTNFFCSASAIRKNIFNNKDKSSIASFMPDGYADMINKTMNSNALSDILLSNILMYMDELESFSEVNREIADRIRNNITKFNDFDSFCELIKTKQFTLTRIRRALLHICLNIRDCATYSVPYIRVLGFRKDASHELKKMTEKATVPVITRPGFDIKNISDEYTLSVFKENTRCSELYRILSKSNEYNEYTHGLEII